MPCGIIIKMINRMFRQNERFINAMRLWKGEGEREKWVPREDMVDINVSTGFNEENIFAIWWTLSFRLILSINYFNFFFIEHLDKFKILMAFNIFVFEYFLNLRCFEGF